jgi:hypothetical protein
VSGVGACAVLILIGVNLALTLWNAGGENDWW